MSIPKNSRMLFVGAALMYAASGSVAQVTNSELTVSKLKGLWLVEAFNRVRALNIISAENATGDTLNVEALFSGAKVKMSASAPSGIIQLEFMAPAGALLSLKASSATTFAGTATAPNVAGTVSATKFEPRRNPDTLAKCGINEGLWEGKWSTGNFPTATLWISAISSECNATILYEGIKEKVAIDAGEFSFVCNQRTGGTCKFKSQGKDLWVQYNNIQGNTNSAAFKPVEER